MKDNLLNMIVLYNSPPYIYNINMYKIAFTARE